MAKLIGDLKLTGTVGDLIFVKTKNGIICRRKPVMSKSQFLNNPNFEAVRNNTKEFGRAGKAVKLLRKAFQQDIAYAKDPQLTPRLQKLMVAIIKTDPVNVRGERIPANGDLTSLEGFEFNKAASLTNSLPAQIKTEIDRVGGKLSFSIPGFVPASLLGRPEGSTHYKLVSACSEIEFEKESCNTARSESGMIKIDMTSTPTITLRHSIAPNAQGILFLVFGIQYFNVINGAASPIPHGGYNALTILKVDMP